MAHPNPTPLPMGSRHNNLKKSFRLAIRSLLTALSKEDVTKAFTTFTNVERESLYRMFVQVIKSLHESIEEEFESICQEIEVGTTLDMIEQLVEEQQLDIISADKTNTGDAKERISKAKMDEIQQLTSLIKKESSWEENNLHRVINSKRRKEERHMQLKHFDFDCTDKPRQVTGPISKEEAEEQNNIMKAQVNSLKARCVLSVNLDSIDTLRSWTNCERYRG